MISRVRWRRALLAIVLLLPTITFADTSSEDSVKAGFVLNFARYTEWPAAVMGSGELKICWVGAQTLAGKLAELGGAKTQGFVVRARQAERPQEWRDCHVFFIPASEAHRVDTVLRTLAQTPTLTVSDAPNFIQAGGMIGLKVLNGRIRFDISQRAARQAGLTLSSRLLRLADEVQQ